MLAWGARGRKFKSCHSDQKEPAKQIAGSFIMQLNPFKLINRFNHPIFFYLDIKSFALCDCLFAGYPVDADDSDGSLHCLCRCLTCCWNDHLCYVSDRFCPANDHPGVGRHFFLHDLIAAQNNLPVSGWDHAWKGSAYPDRQLQEL